VVNGKKEADHEPKEPKRMYLCLKNNARSFPNATKTDEGVGMNKVPKGGEKREMGKEKKGCH